MMTVSDVFGKIVFAHSPNIYTLMLRVFTLFALASGFLCLTAFRAEEPKCNDRLLPANHTQAPGRSGNARFDTPGKPDADTNTVLRILMLNHSAYDSATYTDKMRRLIETQLPACTVSEFWEGGAFALNSALATHDVVVIAYPFGGNPETNRSYGKLLAQFVRQGGVVVLTGTDDYRILQQLDLFDVEFGYFCEDPIIHEIIPEHAILEGTPAQIPLSDFVYPLDVSDPDFVTLVDVWGYQQEDSPINCWTDTKDEVDPASLRNFPVVGYKPLGAGKVVYLGIEYYFDQAEPVRILTNAIRWAAQPGASSSPSSGIRLSRAVKRTEEVFQAGSGASKAEIFDLKIYPNPYYEKATLDIELKKAAGVAVDMTDENGRIVAVVLPQKNLSSGFYRLELPNLAAGVYFVQCKTDGKTVTRKVVKTATR